MAWPFNKTEKAAPDRQQTDTPMSPHTFYLNSGVGVGIIQWNDAIQAKAAMSHPIVSRALNKIAESVQQMKWFAEIDPDASPDDRTGKETFIKEMNALLRAPTPEMTPEDLRYWLALNFAVYGRVPFKVGYSTLKTTRANGIYPLDATQVRSFSNQRGQVEKYEYGTGENKTSHPSKMTWEKNPDKSKKADGFVADIWKPTLRGVRSLSETNTPLNSIGLPAQVIRSLMLRAIQTAEGHPNVRYLITCDKNLTEPQLAALKAHINDDHGVDGFDAGRVPILQNAGNIVIHELKNDLSDIHTKVPSDDMARLIFGAFGIPIALAGIGASDAAKFSGNFDGSRLAFWQDTVIPAYISPLFGGMSRILCPAGVRISPDLDSVPALLTGRVLSMSAMKEINFLTTDEKRELMGWEKTTLLPQNPNAAKTPATTKTPE